jgi:hypothetical protein
MNDNVPSDHQNWPVDFEAFLNDPNDWGLVDEPFEPFSHAPRQGDTPVLDGSG